MVRLFFSLLFPFLLSAATYYVDSNRGRDTAAGTSESKAWKSLERIRQARFSPGDRILFRAGGVYRGQLTFEGSGAEGAPIVIDRYGTGARPKIDGGGSVEDAVLVRNQQWVEVRNLEVTNHGPVAAIRRGVHVTLDNFGTARHIVVSGLYIHDVNGDNKRKDNGGIIWRTLGDKAPSRFDGLAIERNIIWKVDRSGIAAQSYHANRRHWFPSLNVVIRDNYVGDIGGDGVVPWATDSALVEHNIAVDSNRRAATYNAGIWPWSTDNTRLRWNEASFTRTTMDGQGFDSDYNSRNTLFEYNYSHDNEGGFLLVCTPNPKDPTHHIGNTGTTVRYNISRNDHTRTFNFAGPTEHSRVHDNAIYIAPGDDVQLLLLGNWEGYARDAEFRNNLFVSQGTARYGYEVARSKDGTYTIEPGYGPAQGIVFEGNLFAGRHVNRPPDAKAKVEEKPPLPNLRWDGPRFDPARPDGFEAYLAAHRAWLRELMTAQFGKVAGMD